MEYRFLELENKMKCVLIHDEKTEISASVVSVVVGSLENPPDGLGFAHLLEHMLFLGNQIFNNIHIIFQELILKYPF